MSEELNFLGSHFARQRSIKMKSYRRGLDLLSIVLKVYTLVYSVLVKEKQEFGMAIIGEKKLCLNLTNEKEIREVRLLKFHLFAYTRRW